ncbi:hypothetical protein ACFODT_12655 [Vibrio zhugei]|uniref:Uncharacterized protein n=1 Tax=Vibrio zhugei TaxID=2479546 RepID=A0ABV7CAK9_9VIBR|nr:hypothetical protein [Vibrio zhugei]
MPISILYDDKTAHSLPETSKDSHSGHDFDEFLPKILSTPPYQARFAEILG